jgi:hypothetical protein
MIVIVCEKLRELKSHILLVVSDWSSYFTVFNDMLLCLDLSTVVKAFLKGQPSPSAGLNSQIMGNETEPGECFPVTLRDNRFQLGVDVMDTQISVHRMKSAELCSI